MKSPIRILIDNESDSCKFTVAFNPSMEGVLLVLAGAALFLPELTTSMIYNKIILVGVIAFILLHWFFEFSKWPKWLRNIFIEEME